MTNPNANSYALNEADDIISVGPQWNSFARDNAAPNATASKVVGRRIWDFVAGFETNSYLNAIFFACRMDTASYSILYRCDAPEIQRLFRMNIRPEEKGGLTVGHELVHTQEILRHRKVSAITDHHDATRCSICCAFLVGDNWIDAFTDLDTRYFPNSYAVCPDCRKAARNMLSNAGKSAVVIKHPNLN